jgi:hypothetical protein
MAAERSPLRQAFDIAERAVGSRLESGVQTDAFLDFVGVTTRLRAAWERRVEEMQAELLHRLNLPAHSDVVRLSDQLARLERRMRELSDQLEDSQGGSGRTRSRRRTR